MMVSNNAVNFDKHRMRKPTHNFPSSLVNIHGIHRVSHISSPFHFDIALLLLNSILLFFLPLLPPLAPPLTLRSLLLCFPLPLPLCRTFINLYISGRISFLLNNKFRLNIPTLTLLRSLICLGLQLYFPKPNAFIGRRDMRNEFSAPVSIILNFCFLLLNHNKS
jgi:hypothetical protein